MPTVRSLDSDLSIAGAIEENLRMRAAFVLALAAVTGGLAISGSASSAAISWKGHSWQVTSGAMAGVCQGDPSNEIGRAHV